MIVIGIFITVMTGTWQVDADLQKAEETRLRYAVLGQLHKEQATQLNKVNSALVELLGANHDLNNQIQTMIINVDMMRGAIQAKEPEEELLDMTSDIKIVARRIQSLAKEHRKDVEQEWDLKKELSHIRVGPSIEQALKAARLRYPDVDFQAELASPEVQVYVAKGEDTLFRALENVLLNACQGDGTQGAQKIELKVYKGPVGQTLLFEVLDDGPGFSEELLKPDLTPFETTKDEGTGLGLYTTEKWILASGGSLTRKNRPQGGAHVTIELPMWV